MPTDSDVNNQPAFTHLCTRMRRIDLDTDFGAHPIVIPWLRNAIKLDEEKNEEKRKASATL